MGVTVANDYLAAHVQPSTGLKQVECRYHFGSQSIDYMHPLTAIEVGKLRAHVAAVDKPSFLAELAAAVPWWSSVPVGDRGGFWDAGVLLWG